MTDRRLLLCMGAGVAGLVAGTAAEVGDVPALALLAGVAAMVAAMTGASVAARLRVAEHEVRSLEVERTRLRRELDALAAIFSEESTRRGALRTELADARPEPVVDPVSGLLDEQFLDVLVRQRVAAARRQLQPVSVVLFHVDGVEHVDERARKHAIEVLGDVVRRTLRECDTAFRVADTMAAAVLEDTAEAGAVWAAERVRGTLHGSPVGDALTVSAGIACYPSHALDADDLMTLAARALEAARSRGRDHVEVAQAD